MFIFSACATAGARRSRKGNAPASRTSSTGAGSASADGFRPRRSAPAGPTDRSKRPGCRAKGPRRPRNGCRDTALASQARGRTISGASAAPVTDTRHAIDLLAGINSGTCDPTKVAICDPARP